ncbi:MAG TPA: mechanosensitive ion channel family protein [Roseiarcus sp.]|nr:mechanosensitive ion channel family protein [Roseiarcus sp.]
MSWAQAALSTIPEAAQAVAATLATKLFLALVILVVGVFLSRWAERAISVTMAQTAGVDETARPALAGTARYAILILTFVATLSQLGVQTASLLAALGAAGLAIGLALQGTLANIAAGIMLLWLRPFRVGDYVEVVSGTPFAGTVTEIGLFACLLETYDGLFVFAPNSSIWTFPLRNHSRTAGRLLSFNVGFAPGTDMAVAREVLLLSISQFAGVLAVPPPDVFIAHVTAGAPLATCRLWAASNKIGEAQRTMLEAARDALERAGLRPTELVRTIPPESDPSRLR